MYAKFSEKLTYLKPWYAHVHISGVGNVSFSDNFAYLPNEWSLDLLFRGNHCQKFSPLVIFCAIWYHLYNLKNVENTHGGCSPWVFLRLLNCTNGTKSRNAWHITFAEHLYKPSGVFESWSEIKTKQSRGKDVL